MTAELKFVITGTAGVGKSTAIQSISDTNPIITDEKTTDELSAIKNYTTVAFDFGEISLDDGSVVRIYGTPGQERFRHMWEILADGALGLIILVDDTRENPVQDLSVYIENFEELINKTGCVVGITRTEITGRQDLSPYMDYLMKHEYSFPVIEVDPRNKEDMVMILDMLMTILEFA